MSKPDNSEFWLFGYGSLIWKPPPHFGGFLGTLKDMYAGFGSSTLLTSEVKTSEDHRGTPEAPGRTVTIIERSFWKSLNDRYTIPEDKVWGVAYRIEATKVAEVRENLDIREQGGYSIQYTNFYPAGTPDRVFTCLVYVGMPDNPNFAGVQEPQTLAAHILASRGPSGENKEYLYMLEKGLEELSNDSGDAHVSDLVRRAQALEAAAGLLPGKEHDRAIEDELKRARDRGQDTDVMEEAKKGP